MALDFALVDAEVYDRLRPLLGLVHYGQIELLHDHKLVVVLAEKHEVIVTSQVSNFFNLTGKSEVALPIIAQLSSILSITRVVFDERADRALVLVEESEDDGLS